MPALVCPAAEMRARQWDVLTGSIPRDVQPGTLSLMATAGGGVAEKRATRAAFHFPRAP